MNTNAFTIVRQDITKIKTDAIVMLQIRNLKWAAVFAVQYFKRLEKRNFGSMHWAFSYKNRSSCNYTRLCLPASYIIHVAGSVYNPSCPKESEKLLHQLI